jgi:NAD(P)-dependent dehydrogenase (short-subunit alcohol dehydrogenase family)
MDGKIIIYGGSGGIGSETANLLHAQGYHIHLVARNEERLATVADKYGASYTVGDVLDTKLFSQVMSDAGGVCNGLVYAVGTINTGSLRRLTATDYMLDFKINTLAAALAAQAAVPAMKKSRFSPSMVFFSSIAALRGFPLHSSIGMAKGAVNGLVLSLAAELAPTIRVNAIAPSITDTPLALTFLKNEELTASIAASHPLKRIGKAEEIARLVVFLLTQESAWITGQIISADGGRSTLHTA